MPIGSRLRLLRNAQKITQRVIADKLNLSVSTLSNYERDMYAPNLETISLLADYFHVSTDYLLGRVDIMYDPRQFAELCSEDTAFPYLLEILTDKNRDEYEILQDYCRKIMENDKKNHGKESGSTRSPKKKK